MGIGFAIPIEMAKNIEQQLKEKGKVIRGYLGILCQDITPDMAELLGLKKSEGIIISNVEKDSPADKAGLKGHDIILELNGKKIESYDTFRNEIADIQPDSKIKLTVSRDGEKQNITVTLGERPADGTAKVLPKEQPKSKEALGIEVQDVTNDIARQLGYKAGEGVVVTSVDPGSPAGEAGIESGDLILSVDRKNVNSADEFEKAISKIKGNKVLLLVKSGDVSQFIVIQLVQ
jgi:serine protease Do